MKNITILGIAFLLAITSVFSQVPQAFKYQAIVRSNEGLILANQNVSLRLSILKESTSGAIVYSEIHELLTNSYGLINLTVGEGTLESGDFTKIDWGSNKFFIKIEFDKNGGTNFTELGISQLLSVPFALYANKSAADTIWNIENDYVYRDGNVCIGNITERVKNVPLYVSKNVQNDTNTVIARYVINTEGSATDTDIIQTDYVLRENTNPHLFYKLGLQEFQFDNKGAKYNLYIRPEGIMQWGGYEYPNLTINNQGFIGINQKNPQSRLQVTDGDIYIDNILSGIIMRSPDGHCWRITLNNDGEFQKNAISCPDVE